MSDKCQLSSMLGLAGAMLSVESPQTGRASASSCGTRTPPVGAALFGVETKRPFLLEGNKKQNVHLTENEPKGRKWVFTHLLRGSMNK